MGYFNFPIKRESYEASINQAKILLQQDDIESGLIYVNKAINLANELINNCVVNTLKESYILQAKQLMKLRDNLGKGLNPFSSRPQAETPTNNQTSGSQTQEGKKEESESHFFKTEPPSVTLKDIAGLDKVKEEIELNVIAPMKSPEIYYQYTDNLGCNMLMYGPPGCGKSFIAEAIAGELKCAYAIINVYDILDKYVGEAPKKIAAIFKEAEKYDNCLIFFDELDTLFASRESEDSTHTKDSLTSFLTCLSGFHPNKSKNQVRIVIGATNRPWILDSALLRGKRLDTHIYVGIPDEEARTFLVSKEFKHFMPLLDDTDVDIAYMVEKMNGYSGADITSMVNKIRVKALSRALRNKAEGIEKKEPVTRSDVDEVVSEQRNSITEEMLEAFEAFKNGEI